MLVLYAVVGGRGSRVTARSAFAGELGIVPGMPLAEAQSLAGREYLSFFEADDPVADRQSLERLAHWCQRLSPIVSIEGGARPESLFIDVTGSSHLWGGEEGLAHQALEDLSHFHLTARLGISDTIGSAWGVAHYAFSPVTGRCQWIDQIRSESIIVPPGQITPMLGSLSVESLRLPEVTAATLHELGIHQVSDVEAVSRERWMSRFGPELLLRLDQAMGRASEVLIPEEPPPELEASWVLEFPITHTDAVLKVVERLLRPLIPQVRRGWGITRLEIFFHHESSARGVERLPVGLCRPSIQPDHLLGLVRLALERTRLAGAVVEIRVRITGTALMEIFQGELFQLERNDSDEIDGLIDRLSMRLGRRQVVFPRFITDAQPERCSREEPASDAHRRHSSFPLLHRHPYRPTRLFLKPRPIEVHAIHPGDKPVFFREREHQETINLYWGPERIETGWWRGRPIGRDYYRIELAGGQRLWIFRDLRTGNWFLHGAFE